MAAPIYIPTNSVQVFPFLHIFTNTYYFLSYWWWPVCQVWGDISLWFWLAFPWWLVIVLLSIFSCVCWPLVYLWKNHFHHFKIDSYLVTLSIFTVFCNDHIYLFPEHFCHPKKKQCLPNSNVSLVPPPLLVTTTLSISVNLSLWALHTLSFCVWLFLLSVIFSRSIYVAIIYIRISFLFEAG